MFFFPRRIVQFRNRRLVVHKEADEEEEMEEEDEIELLGAETGPLALEGGGTRRLLFASL